jgi:hypothetical protein
LIRRQMFAASHRPVKIRQIVIEIFGSGMRGV